MYEFMYACMFICIYVCMYVCMYVCIIFRYQMLNTSITCVGISSRFHCIFHILYIEMQNLDFIAYFTFFMLKCTIRHISDLDCQVP